MTKQKVQIWSTAELKVLGTFASKTKIQSTAFSADGTQLLIVADGKVFLWDWQVKPEPAELPLQKQVKRAVFDPDSRRIAVVTQDGICIMQTQAPACPSAIGSGNITNMQ